MLNLSTSLLATILLLNAPFGICKELDYPVISVEDGDTIVVEIDGQPERLQLMGIDAPESVGNPKLQRDRQRTGLTSATLIDLGQEATRHLETMVSPGQRVTLEGGLQPHDKYGRIPTILYSPAGRPLSEAMVEDGFAVVLNRYPLPTELKQQLTEHEKSAATQERGLWNSHPKTMQAWSERTKQAP